MRDESSRRPVRRLRSDGESCRLAGQLRRGPRVLAEHLVHSDSFVFVPRSTASPTPSAEELHLRKAEQAVVRFWRVIDHLSADPDSDLTRLTTVSRGSVATQWAKNINEYRFDQVKAEGHIAVRDVTAKRSKDDNFYKVTACIDASNINFVDKNGKSVVSPGGPRQVTYDYTVEEDQQKWYVIAEKVTKTC